MQLVDVDCDWQAFRAWLTPTRRPRWGWLTGPPLDGVDSDWARAWRVEMARAIAACAVELARNHLAAGSPEGARETARRGLLAVPYDDGLWVVLLDAAATAGLGAVGEQWEEIVAVLGDGREASVPPSVWPPIGGSRPSLRCKDRRGESFSMWDGRSRRGSPCLLHNDQSVGSPNGTLFELRFGRSSLHRVGTDDCGS